MAKHGDTSEEKKKTPLTNSDLLILIVCIGIPAAIFIWGWLLCKNGDVVVFSNTLDLILYIVSVALIVCGIWLWMSKSMGVWNTLTIVGIVGLLGSFTLTVVSNFQEGNNPFYIIIALFTKVLMALAIVIVLLRLLSAYILQTATTTTVNGVSRRLFKYEREMNLREASEISESCINFLRTFIH